VGRRDRQQRVHRRRDRHTRHGRLDRGQALRDRADPLRRAGARTRGIQVKAIVTGNVDTPLHRALLGVSPDADLPPAPNPTGRTAQPAEIAAFVAFLLGDESRFITGAALPADGGATAT
jgi:NAD(P)-dependent dehydrogenase (short-subunit alcohol dehydrogenase family)